jgi:tRNA threonylcarbamoyladenosine biosynthesis protein TsaB
MLLLALDTSTRQASVALCTEEMVYSEYLWQIGNNHSVELLERIQRMMAECQMSMQQLDALAVAAGPGSFNGMRVALATAKALAFALKKPLVGVSTLDVIAAQQQQWQGPICAMLEAGRGELYGACYTFEALADSAGNLSYSMRRLSDYMLLSPSQFATTIQEQGWLRVAGEQPNPQATPFLFCGEISAVSRATLATQMGEQALFVSSAQAIRRASVLAMLALDRLHHGEQDDPLLLEPLYLRRPSITTSKRKQPLLGTPSQEPESGQSQTEREQGALRH